jgi:formate hydrogenlyase subunit 6/NADH:ubiquinone oxidoreductase subunit I
MRIGTMLKDVIGAFFQKPVTQKYPFERTEAPVQLRGKLIWDASKCTGCGLCAKDCPADAIELVVNDKKTKQFVMLYHMDRCTFCSQCVQNCRFGCLDLSDEEWEMAALNKDPFKIYYGPKELVRAYLESLDHPIESATPAEAGMSEGVGIISSAPAPEQAPSVA